MSKLTTAQQEVWDILTEAHAVRAHKLGKELHTFMKTTKCRNKEYFMHKKLDRYFTALLANNTSDETLVRIMTTLLRSWSVPIQPNMLAVMDRVYERIDHFVLNSNYCPTGPLGPYPVPNKL